MTDQVESLDVGFQDGVSAGAKKATDAITGLGDAFTAAEAKAERAGKGTKKATDEAAAGAAAAGKAIDAYADKIERADERVKRHSQTEDQLANKYDRTKREANEIAKATARYRKDLEDLEQHSISAAEKEQRRANIMAMISIATERARAKVAKLFADMEAGAAAATASAGGMSAGMIAATASAGSWAGALGKVYETAGSATNGLTQAARALRALNADFLSGHADMTEWAAGAKGLEASLRGVSAAQKAINDSVGLSRQTANTATIGPTRYATTGRGSSGTGSITFGDDGSAQRLDDIAAAFAEADAKLDGYRASLGLTDIAQQRYDAGLAELQATIRRAGVDEAEATRLLTAYAAAHDPAIKKAQELATAQTTAAKEAEQAERAALAKMSADWDAAVREREADAAMIIAAEKEAAAAVKQEETALRSLVGTLDRTFGAEEKLAASQQLLNRAMTDGVGGIKLTKEQHEALSRTLKDQHDLATRSASSTTLAAHESLNLGYQLQDFVVQVGSGQGLLTPILQQAPQAVGAVGGLDRAMALLTTRTALTAMGVGTLAVGFGLVLGRANTISAELREFNGLLRATGDQAGMTAEQMRKVAEGMVSGGASREDANTVVKNIVNTRKLAGEQIARDIGSLSIDMGGVFGGTSDAGRMLTGWLTTGVKGLREMAAETGALSVAQYEAARAALEHGDREKALAIAIGALKERFSGLHRESLSPAGQAMEDLSRAYNELLNTAAEHPIVVTVQVVGADVLREISKFIKDPANFQFPTFSKETEFPNPFGWFIRLAKAKPNPTLSEGALTGREPALPPAPAGTPIPGRKPTQMNGLPLDEALTISDLTSANDKLLAVMQKVGAERVIETARIQAEMAATAASKSDKAAELEGIQAARMARAQLVQAVNDNNRAAAAEVAGADLVARAYGQSTAAVREAEIQSKALTEVARGTVEPFGAIVTRLRALDDAQRKVQAASFDATLKQQTEDANRLAAAWGQGANAAREAALANEALAEARKRGLDPTKDAGQIKDISAGILARDDAQRSQQFAQMAEEQRRAVELANSEYAMLGQSNAERAKAVAVLQTTNELRDKGVDLTDAGTQAYIRQAGELARVNSQLQDSAQQAANISQPITTAFEDVVVGAKKASDAGKALAEDLKRVFVRTLITKPAETWLTGTLTKLMSGGVTTANDNVPKPANDPAKLDRIVGAVKGGLGTSADNAMWVQMAGSTAAVALDPQAMTGRLAPAASESGKVALSVTNAQPLPVAVKSASGLEAMADQIAGKYGLDASLFKAVITRESTWNPNAVNPKSGAAGLGQVMPANWKAYGITNPFDPEQNLEASARILREHLDRAGGDVSKALSTYSGHIKTSGDAYVASVMSTKGAYDRGASAMETASRATSGVTAAQERALQAQLDAVEVQRGANDNTQTMTATQQSWVDSALGLTSVTKDASSVIEVQSRAVSHIGENAISAADGLTKAGDGASAFGAAATDGADSFLGGIQKLLSGAGDWVSGLFGGGSSGAQQQKVIKNADGSTSFAPAAKGAGGSWLDAKVFGSGEQSRPNADFVGPMPQQSGIAGWNPSWGQVIQGIGGIASGAAMATQKGATVGQQIGGGLTAAGGIAAMIPGGQIVGGVMMAAGALLSAVTGAKDRGEKYSISHITLGANGKYALGSYAEDNGGDPTRFNADASKVAKGLNDIAARLNLTPKAGDSYIDSKNKSAEQAALDLLKGMQSGVPEISYAIAHESAVSLEDMLNHLEFANGFNDQVKALRSSISDLFSQFQTGVSSANTFGKTLLDMVDNAQTVFAVTKGAKLPGFARGTVSAPSGWAVVGEEGPEVVRLAGGERIWNARESARMLAGQGIGADTELVHVRPDELAWMDRTLGGRRTNPVTGLPMYLEGDTGGVGDTGGHSGGGHNSNGSGPTGGENAATGSAYGSTADRDAAYGGGWGTSSGGGGGVIDTISGWVSAVTGWMSELAGWQADTAENTQAQTATMAAVAGLGPTAVAAALSAAAQVAGTGLTGMLEAITGEKGTAPAVSHDYGDQTSAVSGTAGTIGERAVAATGGRGSFGAWQGASATEIDNTLAALAAAIKADPTGKLTSEMVGASRVGDPGSGGISVKELADNPAAILRSQVGDPAIALQELDTAAQQMLKTTGAIPEVLQRALDGANARAAAVGIPTATTARQTMEAEATRKADALQQQFDAVGLVRSRVSELNDIVVSLGNNTFTPVGKDFDALAADMQKAATAYVAAGQAVPDGLFGAMKQMEALGAVKKRLLDEVAGTTIESSPEQQKVEQLKGKWSNTATDLVKAFASVGIVGDELAAKLQEGFNNSLKKEQKSYSDGLDTSYRKAKGEEGYDSATGLIDSYKTAVKDVNALWPEGADRAKQMAKVTGTLTAGMEGLVKSGSITSTSLQEIITTFADTPEVVTAATAAMKKLNDATAEATKTFDAGVNARMHAALGNTRGSGLITLDEQQRQELKTAKEAGRDTAQLQMVQSAERGQKAFELAQQDVLSWYDQEITARQTFISDLQDGALKVSQAAAQFAAARDALAISQDAPISPQERLAETKRQWDAALATVRSTTASDADKDTARSNLISLGQTLTSIEKENSGGTARSIYDEVMRVLGELGTVAPDSAAATASAQLKTAQDALKELQKGRAEAAAVGQKQLGSLDTLKDTLGQSLAVWQAALTPLLGLTGTADTRTHYSAPAAVQSAWDGLSAEQQHGIARAMGWSGGIDEAFNLWLGADKTRASTFEGNVGTIGSGARYGAPEDVQRAWNALSEAQQSAAVKAAGYDGGIDAGLNAWVRLGHASAFEAAVRSAAHTAGVPGFAAGTLSTPPGAVWVGERGPELLWQGGGAAVASSVDSMRIAGMYQTAANDRYPVNVTPIQPPAGPVVSDNREAVEVLRDIARRIERLEKAIHEAEGEAQFQRSRIARDKLKVLQQQLTELQEQPTKRFA